MIERESGHIVTVASCAAIQGVAGLVPYAASQAARRSFHDILNLELIEEGMQNKIHLTCVTPYYNNEMFKGRIKTKLSICKQLGFDLLDCEYVATEIIRAIEYNEDEIFLPDTMRILWMLKCLCLPKWLSSYIMSTKACGIKLY